MSAHRKAGSLGSNVIRGLASCDWLTYMPYRLREIFKRDSISTELFSIELVTDFHLVTSKSFRRRELIIYFHFASHQHIAKVN